jgi:hypothetical protein
MIRNATPLACADVPAGVTEFFQSGKLPEPPGLASRAVAREVRLAIYQALHPAGRAATPHWRRQANRMIERLAEVLAEDHEANAEARAELEQLVAGGWRRWP